VETGSEESKCLFEVMKSQFLEGREGRKGEVRDRERGGREGKGSEGRERGGE
jgi:hypothetical protein